MATLLFDYEENSKGGREVPVKQALTTDHFAIR
jgi:hypothetical protein